MKSVELFLALRYLKGSRRTRGGSLTSVIAVAGVTVGVAALIATLAVMTGFREDIRAKILGAQPHLLIQPASDQGLPEQDYSERFEGISEAVAWSPYVMGQALAKSEGGTQGVVVKGVDTVLEPKVTGLQSKVIQGDWQAISSANVLPAQPSGILLGKELAQSLRVGVGDRMILAVPTAENTGMGNLPFFFSFAVVGILQTGLYDYDSSLAVVSLPTAQKIFNLKGRYSGVGVRLKDADEFSGPAIKLQQRFSSQALVRSWLGMNRPLFAALQLEKVVMFLILALITLVAAFTILSNLLLVTAQRTREIGILRAMGATRGTIQRIFLLKGFLMGLIGTGVGTALGLGISFLLKHYEFVKLPADVYYVERLPVKVIPGDVVLVAVAAVVIVLLATLYPARAAAKLDALDAIRRV
ncbi:MAG: ABC transporter permease [Elusimicrobia bacterium]|nr:ABC transporter permease [Elusimicrobiota bacterium]